MIETLRRETVFSEDRKYRYALWRSWADDLFRNKTKEGYVMFIGLNPSTADETLDDPTIRRCMGFTKRWGYLSLCMTNIFAFRATDPKVMRKQENPVGEDNPHHLLQCASGAALVVAAWGCNGDFRNQDLSVKQALYGIGVTLKCLRKTRAGHPEHPLYVPYETELIDL